MNTAVVNVKVDPRVKKEARKVAEDLGLSLSGLINGFLKQLIRNKTVTFSALKEEPSEYLLDALRQSKEDVKAGRVVSFASPDEEFRYLDKLIANDKKHKQS